MVLLTLEWAERPWKEQKLLEGACDFAAKRISARFQVYDKRNTCHPVLKRIVIGLHIVQIALELFVNQCISFCGIAIIVIQIKHLISPRASGRLFRG
jgi:hypothetical protein